MQSMSSFRILKGGLSRYVFCFLLLVFIFLSPVTGEESNGLFRNRVYRLRHSEATAVRDILNELSVGTDVNILPQNSLIVSSNKPEDLIKATSIIKLLDSEADYETVVLVEGVDSARVPSREMIINSVGNVDVGSLLDPPASVTKPRIILDIHDGNLIGVVPSELKSVFGDKVLELYSEPGVLQGQRGGTELEELAEKAAALTEEDINDVMGAGLDDGGMKEAEFETGDSEEVSVDDELGMELLDTLEEARAESEEAGEAVEAADKKDRRIVRTEVEVTTSNQEDDIEGLAEVLSQLKKMQEGGPGGDIGQAEETAEGQEGTVTTKQELEGEVQRDIFGKQEKSEAVMVDLGPGDDEKDVSEKARRFDPAEHEKRLKIDESEKELELTITLPQTVEITSLLELVGKQLGLNYIFDPAKVRGNVMLKIHDGKVKVKDMYTLLETVLKFRGFVMSRKGNLVTIVPAGEALDIDPAFRSSTDEIEPGDVVVTSVFQLEYISTVSAENILKKMKLGTIDITGIEETGTIIVTEYAYRMPRVEEILDLVDVPGEPKRFAYRQLMYTLASNLAPKVQTLAEQLEGVSVTISKGSTSPKTTSRSRTSRSRSSRTRRPTPKPTQQGVEPQKESVFLDTDDRTNRIFMIGMETEIELVNEIIDALDVQQQDLRTIRQYEIQYVGADEVRDKLSELGVIGDGGYGSGSTSRSRSRTSRTSRTAGNARTPAPQGQEATSAEEIIEGKAQVVVLESTNSLLVNATPEQHIQIAMITAHIDAELEETANPYVIYSLENQDPEDMAEVLQEVVEAQMSAKQQKESKIQSTTGIEQDKVIIVPDKQTFSIIVYANRKKQEQIGKLIEVLDKRRPQVLIDVALVEIKQKDVFEYDLNIVANAERAVTGNLGVTGGLLPISGATGGKHWEGGWNLTDSEGSPSGAIKGFYGDEQIQALFELVKTKSYGRILAQPKLLANDNEEGILTTTTQTWRAINKITYVEGQDSANPLSETDYKDYTATIELMIKPTISEGDLLRLEITMQREDFAPQTEGETAKPPDKDTTEVTTVVTVPDGDTIILGGLTKLNQGKGGSKIPILGDIPIIGNAFRTVNNSIDDSYLYIFVKSNIVRPDPASGGMDKIKNISDEYRLSFEEQEIEFQEHEDFTGVKPTRYEPENVLEDITVRK